MRLRLAPLILCLGLFSLSGSLAISAPADPTINELVATIDAFHGPCGHAEGDAKLSGILLEIAQGSPTLHAFTAFIVECQQSVPLEMSDSERLFEWLGLYEHDHDYAWRTLEARQQQAIPIPPVLRQSALIVSLGENPKERASILIPMLRKDADSESTRMAFLIDGGKYPDPFARGLGTELDATGTLYRAAFADVGILPICSTCPAEPRGTDAEQAWARMFLAIHARHLPQRPDRLLAHPTVQPWVQQYREGLPLERAQAAVVLLRLIDQAEKASP